MDIFIIIGLIILCALVLFVFLKNKTKSKLDISNNGVSISNQVEENSFPSIQIIEDNMIVPLEKNKISEPKIKEALATIDNVIPKSSVIGKDIKSGKELLNNNRAFFSAVKKGTENMQPVGNTGRVYGGQMVKDTASNKMLYNKQTQFTREDALINVTGKNALVNAGFNAASMVVGQYYMSEINDKLQTIQNNINDIQSDMDSEYQGKLMNIVSKIKEVMDNKIEILNNKFLRDKRYDEISRVESICTTLLGQANTRISKYIAEEKDYKSYENDIKSIDKWLKRQQILLRLLLEIGNLKYVLSYGNETSISAHSQYNNYIMQTNKLNKSLSEWHNSLIEKFGIISEEYKRKTQFYEFKKNTIGRINKEWAYNKLNENVVDMINEQLILEEGKPYLEDKQDKSIKILKKDGEYYNLPKKLEE